VGGREQGWKKITLRRRVRRGFAERRAGKNAPTPLFFVSVASKGLSQDVSLLFATLAGRFISVAAKGLTGAECWRESNWEGQEDFGGVRRTTWRASMVRRAPSSAKAAAGRRKDRANLRKDYNILVPYVKGYL
jgi:hypothetical protein